MDKIPASATQEVSDSQIHTSNSNLLSPWRSATHSDDFWDRSLEFPGVSGVGMEQDSEPVPVRTLPFTPGASQLRLSRPSRVSHTVTRPAEIPTSPVSCTTSRQDTLPAGIRSDPFSRTRWPMNFAYPPMPMGMPNLPPYPQPFDPYSAQSVWSGQGFGGRPSSESSSLRMR
ncbi:unnamed protein product [Mytilus edulis]|uniref:Uncharacterized protein n=1 Tax=Mytilus edulis TaxID=6550 RepID=A0A8S3QTJ0_MYTED|nr:unnamed protein product [Mytilus edulis]